MTNTQLLLSIGIPSILIVLAWLSNNHRFNAIDARFDRMERLLEGHENRLDNHGERLSHLEGPTTKIVHT
jgi:ribosome-associated translation inhibitor RaiA